MVDDRWTIHRRVRDSILPLVLLGLTATTGMVDAVSFLALGHVFTANMTGNVVFLGFAAAGVEGLSIGRSAAALAAFLGGAVIGGRLAIATRGGSRQRWTGAAFGVEAALLAAAAATAAFGAARLVSIDATRVYALIILTGLAMGVRNATVRKLSVPGLTTTVLTLTLAGVAADSTLAGGSNPARIRRIASVVTMFAGAAVGAWLLRYSIALPLAVGSVVSATGATIVYCWSWPATDRATDPRGVDPVDALSHLHAGSS
jgi:uncharacterized membrane protein YoaK (UPF0700 family)